MLIKNILESLKILTELRKRRYEEIEQDKILASAIIWNLYVVVQGSIDLALKVISLLNLRTPESYSDAFRILGEEGLLPKQLVEKLMTMARFRHILAHAYTRIDLRKIYEILQKNLDDVIKYLNYLKEKLKEKGIDVTEL